MFCLYSSRKDPQQDDDMSVINTNIKAEMAISALRMNERPLAVAMQQMSTGKRINSARDDAAGLAIANWMTTEVRSLTQAIRNSTDAISLLQTADGASSEITEMLQRMRELSVLSANDTYSAAQRQYMNMEYQQLKKQMVQIADNTEWNGFPILNGSNGLPIGFVAKTTGFGHLYDLDLPSPMPAIGTQDLSINGVAIGIPQSEDDELSPLANRQYSAIARAAAINARKEQSGVRAIVQPNKVSGFSGDSFLAATSGNLVINGKSTSITTTSADPLVNRDVAVRAINEMAPYTGIRASAPGPIGSGISLTAEDGRNIEAQWTSIDGNFSILQTGSIALTSDREEALTLSSTSGRMDRWGLTPGEFKSSLTRANILPRTVDGSVAVTATPLQDGDLTINGVAIRGTTLADDDLSELEATVISSDPLSSAIAMAAAINESAEATQVHAIATPARLQGQAITTTGDTWPTLRLNNVDVTVVIASTDTAASRLKNVAKAINFGTITHGVKATLNDSDGIDLTTPDGRNLSVDWDGSVSPAELGLSDLLSPTDGLNTQTFYGAVTLESEAPFTIEPGVNGYDATSNFTALGFQAGSYGSHTSGQLSFQVGARHLQRTTIDMPDFGKDGALTGLITADVNEKDPLINIASVEKANESITLLDQVLNNVNLARANVGAVINRLNHGIDNLTNVSINTAESRSKIQDTDYAQASSEVARTQIIQQAATAILAQANANQQYVMKLLQG
jgi:flagellin